MSKDANPGELRTAIIIEAYTEGERDEDGYIPKIWGNVFGERCVYVKWVNLHGTEAWMSMSHNLKDPATITCRYTPKIDQTCRVIRVSDLAKRDAFIANGKTDEADALYFEVISIDNVDEQNEWLEIRVQRWARAK